MPTNLAARRAKLADMVVEAEATRKKAADALAIAENRLSEADSLARETQAAVNQARETQVRLEATLDGNKQRLDETAQRVREALQIEPEQALAISGHDPEKPFPEAEAMESKLEKLRRERENLGGVNLRAAEEAEEIQQQIDTMTAEHEELTAAINKLRHGIGQLNREGLFNPLFSCSFIDPAENFDFNSFRSKHKVSLVSLKMSPHALLLLAWSTTHRRFASETASLLTIFLENAPKSGSRSSFGFAHLVSINWSYVPFAAVKQSGSGPTA